MATEALQPAPTVYEELLQLQKENNSLKTDIEYWKALHKRATEREHALKKELQDQKARVKYLNRQLYERKTERSKKMKETQHEDHPSQKRKRGQQPNNPSPTHRDQTHLPTREELYDLPQSAKYCSTCGLPFKEISSTDDSEILETQEVQGYRRVIRRKKYAVGCQCAGNKGIITAPGPAKVMGRSRYGHSIWIHILIRKYHLQIPVARILKNLSLHGLSIPPGSVGDGLKRLSPIFEPIYGALEERSEQAKWWQADETRWRVFETTKGKSTNQWYLWVFISDQSVVHVIDPTRSTQVIERHLGRITEGILLVDRYSAYKSFANNHEGVILAFCWAHARRDFLDAGLKYEQIHQWADSWDQRISELFHLNALRMQYPPGSSMFVKEDKRVREALGAMKDTLEVEQQQRPLHYSQKSVLKSLANHWEGLTVFLDHPQIPMDNNGSERTLRSPVVGRKNYYGSGAIWSSRFTAVMFSIFETLEKWDINQVEWLNDYLRACALYGGKPPADISVHLPWNIKDRTEKTWKYCGRVFTKVEIDAVGMLIDEDSTRNRSAIARECCEQLRWYKPDGSLKIQSMAEVLKRMEADQHITLPPVARKLQVKIKPIIPSPRTDEQEDILLPVGKLPEIRFQIVREKEDHSLWNEYMDRYHYLGFSSPLPGAQMKYFVYAGDHLLALLGFGAAAWRVAPRDWYIDWNNEKREKNLHLVVNNARFLILPWVYSKNLASKILSLIAKRIPDDWYQRYNYRPVLLETFVEKNRFSGTCYRAANWKHVGTTKGLGKKSVWPTPTLPKKDIFLYPLDKNFKVLLC